MLHKINQDKTKIQYFVKIVKETITIQKIAAAEQAQTTTTTTTTVLDTTTTTETIQVTTIAVMKTIAKEPHPVIVSTRTTTMETTTATKEDLFLKKDLMETIEVIPVTDPTFVKTTTDIKTTDIKMIDIKMTDSKTEIEEILLTREEADLIVDSINRTPLIKVQTDSPQTKEETTLIETVIVPNHHLEILIKITTTSTATEVFRVNVTLTTLQAQTPLRTRIKTIAQEMELHFPETIPEIDQIVLPIETMIEIENEAILVIANSLKEIILMIAINKTETIQETTHKTEIVKDQIHPETTTDT